MKNSTTTRCIGKPKVRSFESGPPLKIKYETAQDTNNIQSCKVKRNSF